MSAIFGEVLNFTQADGSNARLRVFGDEHYARYETVEGYTAVYDDTMGSFCFADLLGNRLISTGATLGQDPPEGLVRHLKESLAARRATVEARHLMRSSETRAMEEVVRTFGPNQGLLDGRRLSIGNITGLTILVNFQDVSSTTTAADVDDMLNGSNYTRNGNISSARDYFDRVSSGKLNYTNVVVGPYTLSQNRNHYIHNLLVEEALDLAIADGLDLTLFDSQGQGIVDALNVLYAGQSVYQDDLWPHNSHLNLQRGTVRTDLYLLTGLGRNPSELSIGTFCHENGHLLCRFPDMYDYGSRDGDDLDSSGIGHYCLMGAGNHLDNGRSPAPVCAYLRDLAGWCDTVVDLSSAGDFDALHGAYDEVMKFPTSQPNEYFVVENRSRTGLDRALPASGLAVYHCDIFGSNELQQGTAERHYQCALLQADGRRDLESGTNNQGDSTDLFASVAGLALSNASIPSTREWDGRDSGLQVSAISQPGTTMSFRTGAAVQPEGETQEDLADAIIPDNSFGGLIRSLEIGASGLVDRVQLQVDVQHTYIEDLFVDLFAPNGTRVILHSLEGGSADDLTIDLDSDIPGQLGSLASVPAQGFWTLRLFDLAERDEGRLLRWRLEIDTAGA